MTAIKTNNEIKFSVGCAALLHTHRLRNLASLVIWFSCCLPYSSGQAINPLDKIPSRNQETSQTGTLLSGTVKDIVTDNPIPDVTVSIAGKTTITDAKGYYSITGLAPGIDRMELTSPAIIPRSLRIKHESQTVLDTTVKSSGFNNAMFWASANHDDHIMRWQIPPKWVIYSQILDSEPPKEFPKKDIAYLLDIIRKELPQISTFFINPEIVFFRGRPNDDPRWTGQMPADGYILCAPANKGGGNASWKAPGYRVLYTKIWVNYPSSQKAWRHEIAHALGMSHAFNIEKWLPLGDKDPNYRLTKLHNPVEMYTDWDKLWLYCVYSGSRPAGNTPPDRDPDDYIHGQAILNEPNSMADPNKF
jgi:hypothetical protein